MFNQVNNVKNGKPISSILTEKFKPRRADTITIDMTIILMVLQETKPTRTRWIQPISRTHKHTHTHIQCKQLCECNGESTVMYFSTCICRSAGDILF